MDFGNGAVTFETVMPEPQVEIRRLLNHGLVNGELEAIGLLFDKSYLSAQLIQLTPAHWRVPQKSPYQPLEDAKTAFEWAIAVGAVKLLPNLDDSPVVVPLISEANLAAFLDAEKPPPAPPLAVVPWLVWQSEFNATPAERRAKSRTGGRPTDPKQNKAMWHEVVQRAMKGELDGKTLQEVTSSIHQWLTVVFFRKPYDETTVRRQLEGLFPTSGPTARHRRRPQD